MAASLFRQTQHKWEPNPPKSFLKPASLIWSKSPSLKKTSPICLTIWTSAASTYNLNEAPFASINRVGSYYFKFFYKASSFFFKSSIDFYAYSNFSLLSSYFLYSLLTDSRNLSTSYYNKSPLFCSPYIIEFIYSSYESNYCFFNSSKFYFS